MGPECGCRMKDRYRVVVVGAGKRGMHHAAAFQANPRFEVAGLCDIDEVRLDLAAAKLGVAAKSKDARHLALAVRPVRTLSAGQRRRVALARVALSQAPLWLLDEPLNALDAPAQAAFRAVLQKHLAAGGLAIAATHADLGMPAVRTLELGLMK